LIYYLLPDVAEPSWGNGMLYEHVRILRELGYDARALHQRPPFRPTWREVDLPIDYIEADGFRPTAEDLVVVPEVQAANPLVARHPWRRIVFVQGSFLIYRGLGEHADYAELGYESAMAVMPHVAHVVERHFGLAATVVPPYVAAEFLAGPAEARARRILFAVKAGYGAAGIPDHEIALRLLRREVGKRPGWELSELHGLSHSEVARRMRSSLFLVNVHSHEAFNTTVPEAMATGCVPVCYEAVGGREFLRDGENAIVFPNQDVYALVERVCELVDGYPANASWLEGLRDAARLTVDRYRPERTAEALAGFFRDRAAAERRSS
jgi:hypothetical protein